MNNRIQLRRSAIAVVAASFVAAIGSAWAAGEDQVALGVSAAAIHSNAGAGLTVEQRLREELSAVMLDLIQSGAFGSTAPQQISIDVDAPPQKVSNLGLLVDSKGGGSGDGVHVLAVTPGGSAEHMGLRAGDVLLALNGTSLAADGSATLRNTVDALPDGGRLDFSVRRDGRTQDVSGTSVSMMLPAMHLSVGNGTALASNAAAGPAGPGSYGSTNAQQGCGRISDFDVAPRGQGLHEAKIISIDNTTPGPHGSKSYRVGAGTHVVKISERIESRYLSFNDRQRNAPVGGGYKTLTIDVAPDTTYLVAARLNEDQRDNPKDGAYWDPVVWKQSAEPCR